MDDLISRQAAMDALNGEVKITGRANAEAVRAYANLVLDRLERLPPTEPKRGKWIYGEDLIADSVDGYRCDQCGYFIPWDYTHKSIDYINDYNFCPNCGADMREVAT